MDIVVVWVWVRCIPKGNARAAGGFRGMKRDQTRPLQPLEYVFSGGDECEYEK